MKYLVGPSIWRHVDCPVIEPLNLDTCWSCSSPFIKCSCSLKKERNKGSWQYRQPKLREFKANSCYILSWLMSVRLNLWLKWYVALKQLQITCCKNMAWNPLCIYQEDKFLKLLPIYLKSRLFEELANGEVQGFKVGSRFDDTSNCDDITRLSGTWGT